MYLQKTALLFAALAGSAYSQSTVCNSVNGLIAVGVCIEITDTAGAGGIGSYDFTCSPTGTAQQTLYTDNACSVVYLINEDPNMDITCDGVDNCPTMTIANYDSTDCTPTGNSQTIPIVLGCVAGLGNLPGYSAYIQCNGPDGAVAILYDDEECNGNQVAAMLGETGCSDDGRYEEFSCSGDTPRAYDVSLLDESFNDFEATRERQMRPRRRTTRRPQRPRSTKLTMQNLFAMDKMDEMMEQIRARTEMAVAEEDVSGSSIKESMFAMLGVLAVVIVIAAVYFSRRVKNNKALGASENTSTLPTSYGAVYA